MKKYACERHYLFRYQNKLLGKAEDHFMKSILDTTQRTVLFLFQQYVADANKQECINNEQFSFNTINWEELYELLSVHAIVPLFSCLVQYIPKEKIKLIQGWKKSVYSNIYVYSNVVEQQKRIYSLFCRNNIPMVIVKGTAAAQYYPNSQLRTMGDIDLLVKPDDYERAVNCLNSIGCIETTSQAEMEMGRHRSFLINDLSIELHHFFSLLGNREKATVLDTMLFDAISIDRAMLPHEENGLVLLSHIRQHLEDGLGLRQIIDWMMFVSSCLDDRVWYSSFQNMARKTGLETLGKTITKMCQKYMGLTKENITWCENADEAVCDNLIQYIMECGNFGRKREVLQSSSASKIPSPKHFVQLFRCIQSLGEQNWKLLKKHPSLKPFAWIYQSVRCIKIAFHHRAGAKKIKSFFEEGQKRNEMFMALEIK